MQLFYAPDFIAPEYTLSEEESCHAIRVMRLGVGDTLHITDGRGNLFRCEIISESKKRCTVRATTVEHDYEALPYRLVVAVAPTKNIDRFEWFLEKATEIGVTEFVPVECERSERRTIKLDREEKVIVAAMKQSLKAYYPILHNMTKFREFVSQPFEGRKFIAHCASPIHTKSYLASTLKAGENAIVMIGPEGDFSIEEIRMALDYGFEEITLGNQRLRTETAAVMSVAMVSVINNIK